MVFASDAILPIRPLNLAVKRGRLKHLAIEMDGYHVTQVVGMFKFLTRKSHERKLSNRVFSFFINKILSRYRKN